MTEGFYRYKLQTVFWGLFFIQFLFKLIRSMILFFSEFFVSFFGTTEICQYFFFFVTLQKFLIVVARFVAGLNLNQIILSNRKNHKNNVICKIQHTQKQNIALTTTKNFWDFAYDWVWRLCSWFLTKQRMNLIFTRS